MTNYLDLMEVQQWQMRPEMVAKLKAETSVESGLEPVTSVDDSLVSVSSVNSMQAHEGEKTPEIQVVETKLEVNNQGAEKVVDDELVSEGNTLEQTRESSEQKIENEVSPEAVETVVSHSDISKTPPSTNSIVDSVDDPAEQTEFFVYAAISLRQYGNEQKRWLWVVDQASLSREELKLLDNIVMATESEWEESGLADGYMGDDQLQSLLNDDISEVVLFGASHVEFFVNKRVFVTSSISQLVSDGDKKRQTWQGLKQLMQ